MITRCGEHDSIPRIACRFAVESTRMDGPAEKLEILRQSCIVAQAIVQRLKNAGAPGQDATVTLTREEKTRQQTLWQVARHFSLFGTVYLPIEDKGDDVIFRVKPTHARCNVLAICPRPAVHCDPVFKDAVFCAAHRCPGFAVALPHFTQREGQLCQTCVQEQEASGATFAEIADDQQTIESPTRTALEDDARLLLTMGEAGTVVPPKPPAPPARVIIDLTHDDATPIVKKEEEPTSSAAHPCSCGKTFNRKVLLYRHVKRIHGHQFPCRVHGCSSGFATEIELKYHHASAHRQTPWRDELTCQLCSASFLAAWQLTRHVALEHQFTARYQCTDCELSFATKQECSTHRTAAHGAMRRTARDLGVGWCTACLHDFGTAAYLKAHDERGCCTGKQGVKRSLRVRDERPGKKKQRFQ